MSGGAKRVVRGRILTFIDDPAEAAAAARRHIEDGAVLIEDGRSPRSARRATFSPARPPEATIDDHSGELIMPGLIDAHIHYPQTQVIGSYGAQLLDWLHNYTFVEEQKFADPAHARASPSSSSTSCFAAARRRRWSIAPSIRNRPRRSSPPPSGSTRG